MSGMAFADVFTNSTGFCQSFGMALLNFLEASMSSKGQDKHDCEKQHILPGLFQMPAGKAADTKDGTKNAGDSKGKDTGTDFPLYHHKSVKDDPEQPDAFFVSQIKENAENGHGG